MGERYAVFNNIFYFYVIRNGDVMYGINGEDVGLFFIGVFILFLLWIFLDIYGNIIGIEFVNSGKNILVFFIILCLKVKL